VITVESNQVYDWNSDVTIKIYATVTQRNDENNNLSLQDCDVTVPTAYCSSLQLKSLHIIGRAKFDYYRTDHNDFYMILYFIRDIFNDALSISEHIMSNGKIGEQ
jgi:hypothetical protein